MGSGMEIHRWSKMTLLGPRFWFRIVDDRNHEKLLTSQKYKDVRQRNETAARFSRLLNAPIKDVAQ